MNIVSVKLAAPSFKKMIANGYAVPKRGMRPLHRVLIAIDASGREYEHFKVFAPSDCASEFLAKVRDAGQINTKYWSQK